MTSLVLVSLGADAQLVSAIRALPCTVEQLAFPGGGEDVSSLRRRVGMALAGASGCVLAIGADSFACDWDEVLSRLRVAFGLVTGAAQRLRAAGGGKVVVALPSAACVSMCSSQFEAVWLRSLLGMAEALRAELQDTSVGVSIVFHDPATDDADMLAARIAAALRLGQMYWLSADLSMARVEEYFSPMLDALRRTPAGAALPDVGPMAEVYGRG